MTTVKKRIRLGTLFLFLLTLLSSGVGIFHLVRLKNDATLILKNNYESLDFAYAMQVMMDTIPPLGDLPPAFDTVLQKQERNITEAGEQEATLIIRQAYEAYRTNPAPDLFPKMRTAIHELVVLNMAAIDEKNKRAADTADKALTYISILVSIVFLVGLTFSYNFPSVLTTPIGTLTEGLREISQKNYSFRLHLDRKDEFGQMANSFNRMAERLEYFENSNLNKLIFEKSRAEAVINSLKEATIGLDKSDTILFANDQALQLLHLTSADIAGKKVEEVAGKNDLFRFLVQDSGTIPFKIVVDGRENYFTKEILTVEATGKLIVLQNVTSFKELDTAKTNFIATVSHELKTPLAASDFSIKLMEDERTGSLSAEQKELIKGLKQNNQRMLKILSELLNMAQVEAGTIALDIQPVSPASIATLSMEAAMTAATEKEIAIIPEYDDHLPAVLADRDKTSWVLNNFLTNAIRYSPAGKTVVLSIQQEADRVTFSVTDQGPGISAEFQSKIFNRFFKIPGTTGVGTGLGLSISKDFIQAQGGEVGVYSELGKGSTFYFTLNRVNQ